MASGTAGLAGLTVDKSVEFSYEELANATDDFSMSYKIGQGGFGAVYYAELRGEVGSHKYFPFICFCCMALAFLKNTSLCRKLQSRRWICKHQENFWLN